MSATTHFVARDAWFAWAVKAGDQVVGCVLPASRAEALARIGDDGFRQAVASIRLPDGRPLWDGRSPLTVERTTPAEFPGALPRFNGVSRRHIWAGIIRQ